MAEVSTITNGFAKSQRDVAGEKFPQIGETNVRVINKIIEMYEYPAVIFGRWLGISDKSAKRKLGLDRSISAEQLGVLIRSERGFEIVTAVMGDARPEWWRLCAVLMDAADVRKMQMAAQRRIKKTLEGALDADRDLSAAIARAEALAFQGQEQAGIHADALRSMDGIQNRTVAPSKGRRR